MSAMNTALAPKSYRFEYQARHVDQTQFVGCGSIASNVAMPKSNPALGKRRVSHLSTGFPGRGTLVVLPVSRSDQLENALAVFLVPDLEPVFASMLDDILCLGRNSPRLPSRRTYRQSANSAHRRQRSERWRGACHQRQLHQDREIGR